MRAFAIGVCAAVSFGGAAAVVQGWPGGKPHHRPAPQFSAPTLGGRSTMSLRSLAGRPVVLDFWASWCPPCVAELPVLQSAWRSAPPGTVIMGLDVNDTDDAAREAVAAAKVTYPNVVDGGGRIAGAYRVTGTPTIVVIDAEGSVVDHSLGPVGLPRLRAMMAEARR
jgi:cytochrome c biogenesis protein CcmG/thiol:disulfide interchange protein DsbE